MSRRGRAGARVTPARYPATRRQAEPHHRVVPQGAPAQGNRGHDSVVLHRLQRCGRCRGRRLVGVAQEVMAHEERYRHALARGFFITRSRSSSVQTVENERRAVLPPPVPNDEFHALSAGSATSAAISAIAVPPSGCRHFDAHTADRSTSRTTRRIVSVVGRANSAKRARPASRRMQRDEVATLPVLARLDGGMDQRRSVVSRCGRAFDQQALRAIARIAAVHGERHSTTPKSNALLFSNAPQP